jgi:CheY-like chemotaxis protein
VSVKDPSVVRYNDRWHIYATTAATNGAWGMVYLSFADWADAANAKPYYLDENPSLRGYHCAPQIFYFRPQKKWYLIYQSGPPQYSTADDITKPETWTKPESFFPTNPPEVSRNWLDFWIICDATHAYLFCTGEYAGKESCQLPTVVLLDIKLPKIGGLEVLQRMRENERTRRLPVVVLTSSREEADIIRSYELGANSYIRKPVDFVEFTDAVRQLGLYWLLLNVGPDNSA